MHYNNPNTALYKNLIKFSGKRVDQILKISEKFIQSNFYGNTDLSKIRFNNRKKKRVNDKINYAKTAKLNKKSKNCFRYY